MISTVMRGAWRIIRGIRIVNIYLPNGNPVGSEKFAYKLAWIDRLTQQMIRWKQDGMPTLISGTCRDQQLPPRLI